MKTSQNGINLIKQFEGCRLEAYKAVPTEKYFTIGYGHYGADVSPDMKITQDQAETYLRADLEKYENAVNRTGLSMNQHQFDGLVSFAYNCGVGNLNKLISGRTIPQIADAILLYNKSGGKVLKGLVRRRNAERELLLKGNKSNNANPYREPVSLIREGMTGNSVKWIQYQLNQHGYNLKIDGVFGNKTKAAILELQKKHNIKIDGIVGSETRSILKLED